MMARYKIPKVITYPVTNVTTTSASGGGKVTDGGGLQVTERGVAYGTSQYASTITTHTHDGTGLGEFVSNFNDLLPNTKYYVRAYATNNLGTSYGKQVIFTTSTLPTTTTTTTVPPTTTTTTSTSLTTTTTTVAPPPPTTSTTTTVPITTTTTTQVPVTTTTSTTAETTTTTTTGSGTTTSTTTNPDTTTTTTTSGSTTTTTTSSSSTTTTSTTPAPTTTTTTTSPEQYSLDYSGDIYYVSNGGSDSNNGLSENTPFQTITKVNTLTLGSGDAVLFNSEDEFEGSLIPTQSGTSLNQITYGAYGIKSSKPKLYGSTTITGWTLHSGNIWKATISNDINQLFINDERVTIARYPKATYEDGFADITTVNSTTQFISTQITSQTANYYKNAIFVGRTNSYTLYQSEIVGSTGQTLTIAAAPPSGSGALTVGRGFFLINKLEFLTQAGEWYYDTVSKIVYLWTPNGDSPANYVIRGSVYNYGVHVNTKSYITIKDLEISQSSSFGIYLDNESDYTIINNNDIINSGLAGIVSYWWSSDSQITDNYIYEANNYGMYLYNNTNVVVTDNEIVGTGKLKNVTRRPSSTLKVDNINISSWGTGLSVQRGVEATLMHNKLIDNSYIGISFGQVAALIKYNYIDGACQVLDDGGGIYTYTGYETDYDNTTGASGSVIENNIVLNVIGNPDGIRSTDYTAGYGIYMDNGTKDVIIQNNTVSTASGGVFFNPGGFITLNNNTVLDATLLMYIAGDFDPNIITNNTFYATARIGSYATWWQNSHQRIIYTPNTTSSFDYNKYLAHYNTTDVFVNKTGFTQWKTDTGEDNNSTFDGTSLVGETEKLFYNDTKVDKVYTINGATAKEIDGIPILVSFTLQPFTSKIVVGTNLNLIV